MPDGRRVIDQEWVQLTLARVHARLEFLRLINWKVAWSAEHEALDPADASTTKVFGTEFYLEAYRLLMEIVGPRGYREGGLARRRARAGGWRRLIRGAVILTFGGGTNEIQRDIIAMFGLGFPQFAVEDPAAERRHPGRIVHPSRCTSSPTLIRPGRRTST